MYALRQAEQGEYRHSMGLWDSIKGNTSNWLNTLAGRAGNAAEALDSMGLGRVADSAEQAADFLNEQADTLYDQTPEAVTVADFVQFDSPTDLITWLENMPLSERIAALERVKDELPLVAPELCMAVNGYVQQLESQFRDANHWPLMGNALTLAQNQAGITDVEREMLGFLSDHYGEPALYVESLGANASVPEASRLADNLANALENGGNYDPALLIRNVEALAASGELSQLDALMLALEAEQDQTFFGINFEQGKLGGHQEVSARLQSDYAFVKDFLAAHPENGAVLLSDALAGHDEAVEEILADLPQLEPYGAIHLASLMGLENFLQAAPGGIDLNVLFEEAMGPDSSPEQRETLINTLVQSPEFAVQALQDVPRDTRMTLLFNLPQEVTDRFLRTFDLVGNDYAPVLQEAQGFGEVGTSLTGILSDLHQGVLTPAQAWDSARESIQSLDVGNGQTLGRSSSFYEFVRLFEVFPQPVVDFLGNVQTFQEEYAGSVDMTSRVLGSTYQALGAIQDDAPLGAWMNARVFTQDEHGIWRPVPPEQLVADIQQGVPIGMVFADVRPMSNEAIDLADSAPDGFGNMGQSIERTYIIGGLVGEQQDVGALHTLEEMMQEQEQRYYGGMMTNWEAIIQRRESMLENNDGQILTDHIPPASIYAATMLFEAIVQRDENGAIQYTDEGQAILRPIDEVQEMLGHAGLAGYSMGGMRAKATLESLSYLLTEYAVAADGATIDVAWLTEEKPFYEMNLLTFGQAYVPFSPEVAARTEVANSVNIYYPGDQIINFLCGEGAHMEEMMAGSGEVYYAVENNAMALAGHDYDYPVLLEAHGHAIAAMTAPDRSPTQLVEEPGLNPDAGQEIAWIPDVVVQAMEGIQSEVRDLGIQLGLMDDHDITTPNVVADARDKETDPTQGRI